MSRHDYRHRFPFEHFGAVQTDISPLARFMIFPLEFVLENENILTAASPVHNSEDTEIRLKLQLR